MFFSQEINNFICVLMTSDAFRQHLLSALGLGVLGLGLGFVGPNGTLWAGIIISARGFIVA